MDTPPLWQALRDADAQEPVATGLRRSLEIETAFARDYDAAHARLLPALGAFALLLLPLIFWLKRRARTLVAAGQLGEPALQALARPWAAWLLLVAAAAVLYGLQGPNLRQQAGDAAGLGAGAGAAAAAHAERGRALGLPQRGVLLPERGGVAAGRQPAAVPAAAAGHQPADAADAGLAHPACAPRATRHGENQFQARTWHVRAPGWPAACWSSRPRSNVLGNISLSAMLVSATLDSSYVALAMYAGSKVVLALFQVLLAGPTVARLSARYAASLVPAVVNLGRSLLVVAWLLFTLQSFRIYRPVSSFADDGADARVQAGRAVAEPGQPGGVRGGHLGRVLAGRDDPAGAGRGHPAQPVAAARRGQQRVVAELLPDPVPGAAGRAGGRRLPGRAVDAGLRRARRGHRLSACRTWCATSSPG